jgi:hypothetical protein
MDMSSVKDNKKSRFYQYGALIVAICMVVAGGVYGTVTINETSGIADDNGTIIDFAGRYAVLNNLSIGGTEINGSYSEYETLIENSLGRYYPATEQGLKSAVNDLNNQTGYVDGKWNTITLTSMLKLGTQCELRNIKLVLGNSADCTMIMNYDLTNGNDDIYIHDIILEGNGENQSPKNSTSVLIYNNEPCGIFLINCDNVNIHDVNITNTQFGGCYVQQGNRATLRNVDIYKAGNWLDSVGYTPYDCYSAVGIYLYNTTNSTMSQCNVHDVWSAGIVVESTLPSIKPYRCYYTTVSDCVVTDSTISFYCEDSENVTFIGCHASDTSLKNTNFSLAVGFYSKKYTTSNIKYIGCTATNIDSYGFFVSGNNTLIDGCTIVGANRSIQMENCNRVVVTNNHMINSEKYGIVFSTVTNATCTNNMIQKWDADGVGISISSLSNSLVMGNTFLDNANIGIMDDNGDDGNAVMFNRFYNVSVPLYQVVERVNCTDYDNWNFYIGVS